jgi:phosphoribosylanthranilate isomerase
LIYPEARKGRRRLEQVIVQIYEVQEFSEAEALMELGVDHIGSVVMSPDFKQNDPLKETLALVSGAGKKSSLIPLFTDTDDIFRTLDHYRPDIVHFCEVLTKNGSATGMNAVYERQKTVRERFPEISIMRSVPIAVTGLADRVPTLDIARMFEPVSDYFLTDTLVEPLDDTIESAQPVEGFVGITGKTCDWDMARTLVEKSGIPVILAGGISPDNVAMGVSHVTPFGVDSCTLTNALDAGGRPIRFRKDLEKVKRLVEAARHHRGNTENEAAAC